ncbi:MAG: integrase, partial [Deltaproteobacteria bacterium HGW-Deltaproteobacteria-8]
MPLTDTALRNAKPGPKARRIYDSGGLYVEVAPSGGKWFRFKYHFGGKERRLSLGVYPDVSLAQARERRDEARRLLAEGTDPSTVPKAAKAKQQAQAETFELLARQWHEKFSIKWSPGHAARIMTSLQQDAFPWIGSKAIRSILPPEILSVARRVESRGAIETAHRLVGNIGMVFRYAVACGLADSDPTRDLRGAPWPMWRASARPRWRPCARTASPGARP